MPAARRLSVETGMRHTGHGSGSALRALLWASLAATAPSSAKRARCVARATRMPSCRLESRAGSSQLTVFQRCKSSTLNPRRAYGTKPNCQSCEASNFSSHSTHCSSLAINTAGVVGGSSISARSASCSRSEAHSAVHAASFRLIWSTSARAALAPAAAAAAALVFASGASPSLGAGGS